MDEENKAGENDSGSFDQMPFGRKTNDELNDQLVPLFFTSV